MSRYPRRRPAAVLRSDDMDVTLASLMRKLMEGMRLIHACEAHGVSRRKVTGWVAANPGTQELWRPARLAQASALLEELVEILDDRALTVEERRALVDDALGRLRGASR